MRPLLASLLILLLAMQLTGCAATEPFNKLDQALLGASSASLAVDWMQTRQIKRHPELHETNVLLGKHPSDTAVDAYFATALVGNYLLAKALPGPYRRAWLVGLTALEAGVIARNAHLGLSLRW